MPHLSRQVVTATDLHLFQWANQVAGVLHYQLRNKGLMFRCKVFFYHLKLKQKMDGFKMYFRCSVQLVTA